MDTWPSLDDILFELDFLLADLEAMAPNLLPRLAMAVFAFLIFRRARLSGTVAIVAALVMGPIFTAIALGIGHFTGFFRAQRQKAEAQEADTSYASYPQHDDAKASALGNEPWDSGKYADNEYDNAQYDESEYDDWAYGDDHTDAFNHIDDEDPFERKKRTAQPHVLGDSNPSAQQVSQYTDDFTNDPAHTQGTGNAPDPMMAIKEIALIGAGALLVYVLYG